MRKNALFNLELSQHALLPWFARQHVALLEAEIQSSRTACRAPMIN
ncbi:MAG: hypothetical protein IPK76_07115 [Lewinellaceae bacterium]|nr:hypothetical protein [Lewinellaceae bacterium]